MSALGSSRTGRNLKKEIKEDGITVATPYVRLLAFSTQRFRPLSRTLKCVSLNVKDGGSAQDHREARFTYVASTHDISFSSPG